MRAGERHERRDLCLALRQEHDTRVASCASHFPTRQRLRLCHRARDRSEGSLDQPRPSRRSVPRTVAARLSGGDVINARREGIRDSKRKTERETLHQSLSSGVYRLTRLRDSFQPHGTLEALLERRCRRQPPCSAQACTDDVLVEEQIARHLGAAVALPEKLLEVANGLLARSFPAEFEAHR